MTLVLPGDAIALEKTKTASSSSPALRLGPGTTPSNAKQAVVTKPGLLGSQLASSNQGASASSSSSSSKAMDSYWVDGTSRRYTPVLGESVVGVITGRHAEGYRVDIGTAQSAGLDALAFEGATKRSKPNLKIGAVVYARLSLAHNFAEPEIECFDPTTQKAQGFGELAGGMLLKDIELSKCRAMLSKDDNLLADLGLKFPFEVAVGRNGRMWLKAEDIEKTIALVNRVEALLSR